MPDIDIDCHPSFRPADLFRTWVRASVLRDGKLTPHPCGVYPQRMAVDPITGLAAIPYEEAEELGFQKFDFLHLQVYQHFSARSEIEALLRKEPDWNLLLVPSNQTKLFQLSKHGELLDDLRPRSVVEVSDIMALIRPGKRAFVGLYKKDRGAARKLLYARDANGYQFKKSHSICYSYIIVLQLHLIEQNRL